jgi:hypothetical protein
MTTNWELLIDADMSMTDDWQFSVPTTVEVIRIEQENVPELGRFALAQTTPDRSEFLAINPYPSREETTRITLSTTGERCLAICHRYSQFPAGVENNWRIKVYGSSLEFQPAINPSAVVLTLDPRVAGAIPLQEKGIPLGVATLDADGHVKDDQLIGSVLAELVGANMAAVDALANQVESIVIPPTPTLTELGGEPAGAETRSKAYTDQKVGAIAFPPTPTLTSLGGEPAGAETRSKAYTDQKVGAIVIPPTPTLTSLGGEPAGAETRSKAYTDQKVGAIVIPPTPTLTSLGGEPAGAETRSKAYTDQKVGAIVFPYPTSLDHWYGYGGRAYNGFQEKSFNYTVNAASEFGRYASISSPAQYDTYEVSFLLKAGTYSFVILYDRGTTRGVASFYFDDALLGSVDCYASATSAVNRVSYTVNVPASATHSFKVRINSKNASSTGYGFNCTAIFASLIASTTEVRINCGGNQYTDSTGKIWEADKFFSGGSAWDIEYYVGPFTVAGTNDQALYKFERSLDSGSFSYSIPITSGTYNLKLHFSENNKTAAGQRIGTIALNGSNLLSNFDVFVEAGGQKRALIKTFSNLSLTAFTLTITNTLVDAIELVRLT